MAKNSVIISVSIDKDEAEFLDDQKLSPSELIQSKIQEQIRLYSDFNSKNSNLQAKVEALVQEIKYYNEYLTDMDIFDKFYEWRKQRVV